MFPETGLVHPRSPETGPRGTPPSPPSMLGSCSEGLGGLHLRAFRAPRGAIDALELFLNIANWSGRIENDSKSMICYAQCCNQDSVEAIMCSGPAGLILSILELKNNQCFIFMKRDSSCQSQKSRKRAHECIFKITKSIQTPCQSQKFRKRARKHG